MWLASRTDPIEMAGYLDDWAFVRRRVGRPEADWRRLVSAARRGDRDPWRDALRAKLGNDDAETVAEVRRMADDPDLEDQPAPDSCFWHVSSSSATVTAHGRPRYYDERLAAIRATSAFMSS